MGKRRLIGKIVILMLGLAAVVILAANSDIIPVNKKKKGYRVVIDPGHGGSDCGAVGVSGVKEAGLNLAVSLYLKEELRRWEWRPYSPAATKGRLLRARRRTWPPGAK